MTNSCALLNDEATYYPMHECIGSSTTATIKKEKTGKTITNESSNIVLFKTGESEQVLKFKIIEMVDISPSHVYYTQNDNVLERTIRRIKLAPLPVKIYLLLFGTLSSLFFILILLELFSPYFIMNIYYSFICMCASIGLFLTAIKANKVWINKYGER